MKEGKRKTKKKGHGDVIDYYMRYAGANEEDAEIEFCGS